MANFFCFDFFIRVDLEIVTDTAIVNCESRLVEARSDFKMYPVVNIRIKNGKKFVSIKYRMFKTLIERKLLRLQYNVLWFKLSIVVLITSSSIGTTE